MILGYHLTKTAHGRRTLSPGQDAERFVREYQEKFGESPEGSVAGYGFDSLMVIREAMVHEKQNGNNIYRNGSFQLLSTSIR